MPTMTIELSDALFSELQQFAAKHHISTELLLVEMARHNLQQIKAERHFWERAAQGNPERGLVLLDKVAHR